MRTHLRQWVNFLEEVILGRPLRDEEYIFPKMGPNGMAYMDTPMDHDLVARYVNEFARAVGVLTDFSSHCFRRGGAQYRFMYCPLGERWSLSVIRWWGGWAEGEQVCDVLVQAPIY